jgi:hypothetical protein
MFIDPSPSMEFFAPAERNLCFAALTYQYIALRWSANSGWPRSYKHLAPLEPGAGCDPSAIGFIIFPLDTPAGVAKLVYAPDSKSGEVKLMSVRVRPPAPNLQAFPNELLRE